MTHNRLYWISVDPSHSTGRPRIVASATRNEIRIHESPTAKLRLLLHDELLDMDEAILVKHNKSTIHRRTVARTIATIAETMIARNDPSTAAYGRVEVVLPDPEEKR